jgi:hypothetical protein
MVNQVVRLLQIPEVVFLERIVTVELEVLNQANERVCNFAFRVPDLDLGEGVDHLDLQQLVGDLLAY